MTSTDGIRVYCAGPLFNQSERDEMQAIADLLCESGYKVYLPHRDGMEFRLIHHVLIDRGWDAPRAAQFLHAAIFALDVYQLAVECDAMVWNLNGRVPDEGAVSEAAMAWTLGKPLVAYSDDARSLIAGRMNPLLVGMVDFTTTENIDELPELLSQACVNQPAAESHNTLAPKMQATVTAGEKLWNVMAERHAQSDDERIADAVTELFAPVQDLPV